MKATTIGAISLTRAGYGMGLLCAPGAVIGLCAGRPVSARARVVARLLGARHLVQAAVTAVVPTTGVLAAGAGADLAHAASMLALGAGDRPLRRALLSDALVAVVFAVAAAAACAGRRKHRGRRVSAGQGRAVRRSYRQPGETFRYRHRGGRSDRDHRGRHLRGMQVALSHIDLKEAT